MLRFQSPRVKKVLIRRGSALAKNQVALDFFNFAEYTIGILQVSRHNLQATSTYPDRKRMSLSLAEIQKRFAGGGDGGDGQAA